MYPELFSFQLPEFLGSHTMTLFSYAFLIVLGTIVSVLYTRYTANKMLNVKLPNAFFYWVFVMGFLGGKFFLYLEKPMYYLNNPSRFLDVSSGGFVFYGSFICIIVFIIFYLKKHSIPVLPMLDILAITTTIVHSFGRLGCFLAGCCFGKPTDSFLGIAFPKTRSVAVHPTQLYEVIAVLGIMLVLFALKKRQKFQGQIFFTYVMAYAIVRSIIELFRGDERGFVINNVMSHSQGIALCLVLMTLYFYFKQKKDQLLKN